MFGLMLMVQMVNINKVFSHGTPDTNTPEGGDLNTYKLVTVFSRDSQMKIYGRDNFTA